MQLNNLQRDLLEAITPSGGEANDYRPEEILDLLVNHYGWRNSAKLGKLLNQLRSMGRIECLAGAYRVQGSGNAKAA